MKVPANIPFTISLLDANARKLNLPTTQVHRAWLSVRPGELLECNGCHVRTTANGATARSHGRKGSFAAAYAGATATGAAFPGAVNTISPEVGDTMAQARSRGGSSCIDAATTVEHCGPPSLNPSADVVYDEIWKQAPMLTDSFAYSHLQLSSPRPTNASCYPVWQATCRITLHYAAAGTRPGHIHPLWSVPRPAAGVTDDMGNITFPDTCTACHTRVNPVDMTPMLPWASLELTDEISDEDPLQLRAYRQLLFSRPELELVNGAVQPRQIPLVDGNGDPVRDDNGNPLSTTPRLPASMAAGNARGSRFFAVMNNPTHAGMLSPAELRLLSEWLDIGAQYYNDPFPPTPQN
jgi:hypothetical protein